MSTEQSTPAASETTPIKGDKPDDLRTPTVYAGLGAVLLTLSGLFTLLPFQVVKYLFSDSAFGYTQDTSVHKQTTPAAGNPWEAATADPKIALLLKLLLSLVASGLASAGLVNLLLHSAGLRSRLDVDIYRRLLQALALFGAANAALVAINFLNFRLLSWLLLLALFGAVTAAAALPLTQQAKDKVEVRQAAVVKTKTKNWRAILYGVLAIFLFLEAPLVVLLPKRTMEGMFAISGGAVGRVLWQLIGTTVHTIVPAVVFNLVPLAEQHRLNTSTSALLNLAALVPGLIHLYVITRAVLGGLTGPLGPLVGAAWTITTLFSLVNLPASIAKEHTS